MSLKEERYISYTHAYNILTKHFKTERLNLIKGDSKETLPEFLKKHKFKIDLAFIDGGHDYETCYSDLLHIHQRINKGGVIVVDDTKNPNVRKAIREIGMSSKFTELGKMKAMRGFKNA